MFPKQQFHCRIVAKMHYRTPSLPHYSHEQRVPNLKISTIPTRVFKQGAEASSAEGPGVLGFLSRSLQGSPSVGTPLGWITHPWYMGAQHTPSCNRVQLSFCYVQDAGPGLVFPSRSGARWTRAAALAPGSGVACRAGLAHTEEGTRAQEEKAVVPSLTQMGALWIITWVMWEDGEARKERPRTWLLWNRVEVTCGGLGWHHGPKDQLVQSGNPSSPHSRE